MKAETFLQRSDIRTMRKDLQRLRETDVVLESEKIVGAKIIKNVSAPVSQKPAREIQKNLKEIRPPVASSSPKTPVLSVRQKDDYKKMGGVSDIVKSVIGGLFGKRRGGEQLSQKPAEAKKPEGSGTETERQQIFLLKSRRTDLENRAATINKEKKPLLFSEKNKILAKKVVWQKKLAPLIEEEKSATEEQKQNIDRRKWLAEKELAGIEKEIAGINENYKKTEAEEGELKKKIEEINASMEEIYSAIAKKENEKKEVAPIISALKETEKTEEERRKNFLENIEKWASGSKK